MPDSVFNLSNLTNLTTLSDCSLVSPQEKTETATVSVHTDQKGQYRCFDRVTERRASKWRKKRGEKEKKVFDASLVKNEFHNGLEVGVRCAWLTHWAGVAGGLHAEHAFIYLMASKQNHLRLLYSCKRKPHMTPFPKEKQ